MAGVNSYGNDTKRKRTDYSKLVIITVVVLVVVMQKPSNLPRKQNNLRVPIYTVSSLANRARTDLFINVD